MSFWRVIKFDRRMRRRLRVTHKRDQFDPNLVKSFRHTQEWCRTVRHTHIPCRLAVQHVTLMRVANWGRGGAR